MQRRWSVTLLWLPWLLWSLGARPASAAVDAPVRVRAQALTGAALTLITGAEDQGRALRAYVPIDVELALRLSGPVSLLLGAAGYLAPFAAEGARPNGLAAVAGLRLDLSLSARVKAFAALRGGFVGQDGIPQENSRTAMALGLWLGPRVGINLWLGRQVAWVLALGYDHLPRGGAIGLQTGLGWRVL